MNGKLASTVAVLRTHSNNSFARKQVENLLGMGLGKIMVMVRKDVDSDRFIASEFADLERREPKRLLVRSLPGDPFWAIPLNVALRTIQRDNALWVSLGQPDKQFRFAFNVSVEAKFERKHVEKMLDAATDDPSTVVVGTTFQGLKSNNPVTTGRSYRHPRNTGMVLRLDAFGPVLPQFDPTCDMIGGMEDIEFILSLLTFSNCRPLMLDLKVPLVLNAHHVQSVKEEREQKAMDVIIKRYRDVYPAGTAVRDALERVINDMGLAA